MEKLKQAAQSDGPKCVCSNSFSKWTNPLVFISRSQQKHFPLVAAQGPVIAICVASPPARHNRKFWRLYATDVKNHFYKSYQDEQDEIETSKPPSISQKLVVGDLNHEKNMSHLQIQIGTVLQEVLHICWSHEVPKPLWFA